ncbi:MAG: CoB--CoM heterodisulfide reductase iron-sulfur subunit B family protein [Flavobacterium piscis]|nr:CoB--CoM heterodisulfide reductase iron-sulfur subunit B family protein [Flavobacterium piscis]
MDYTYYPGCSLESAHKSYGESVKKVFNHLGCNLIELEDWNCCGATMYMSVKETVGFAISARNLALAEKYNRDVVAPCSACFTVLAKTNRYLKELPDLHNKINECLAESGLSYNLSVRVRHPLDVLVNDIGIDKIKEKAKFSLKGLKIANYYGCQIVRPERGFDDREEPMTMDNLFAALGAENIYYPMKVKCCGGMLMTTYEDVALKLSKGIIETAVENGANCIVTTCPLCQMNVEAYQDVINKTYNTNFNIPVLFFTQVLGLAFGFNDKELGIDSLLTEGVKVTEKL